MEYQEAIRSAVGLGVFNTEDIFIYEDMPNEHLYEELYRFCLNNLEIQSEDGYLSASVFAYYNSFSINARAGIKNQHNVILVNIGLMRSCFEKFYSNEALHDYTMNKWRTIINSLNTPLNHLTFQISTHFTYYHELAHLFQLRGNGSEAGFHERSIDGTYNIINHQLEINADTYATISIATQIQQYLQQCFPQINQNIVEKVIIITGSCLLEYIINFTDSFEIYYAEETHPHPIIRMLNVVMSLVDHLSKNPHFVENGIFINDVSLFLKVISFHAELERENIFNSGFSEFIQGGNLDKEQITSYLNNIMSLDISSGYTDAMSIWNDRIPNQDTHQVI